MRDFLHESNARNQNDIKMWGKRVRSFQKKKNGYTLHKKFLGWDPASRKNFTSMVLVPSVHPNVHSMFHIVDFRLFGAVLHVEHVPYNFFPFAAVHVFLVCRCPCFSFCFLFRQCCCFRRPQVICLACLTIGLSSVRHHTRANIDQIQAKIKNTSNG